MFFQLIRAPFFIALFTFGPCLAQSTALIYPETVPIDSLERRNEAYEKLIFYHLDHTQNFDSALFYIHKGKIEFRSNTYYYARMLRYYGIYFDYIDVEDSCFHYFEKSLEYAVNTKDFEFQTRVYIDYGYYFTVRNKLDSAIYYYLMAAEANKRTENYLYAGVIHNNLGLIKMRQNDYEIARDYFLESIDDYKKCGENDEREKKVMSAYINLTNCYRKLGEYAKANAYCDKVIDLSINLRDTLVYIENLSMKGLILLSMEDYKGCVDVSLKGYKLTPDETHQATMPLLYNLVGGYRGIGLYDSSLFYNQLGLQYSRNLRDSLSFYENFEFTYSQMGDYKNAYLYLKSYTDLADWDAALAEFKAVEEMEQKYRNARKAYEIDRLNQAAEIQRLNTLLLVSLLVSLLVLLLIVGYYIFRRRRIKYELELARQKEKISAAALAGQEEERKRISNDLHDAVGASLANIGMSLARYAEKSGLANHAHAEMQKIQHDVDAVCKEVRTISHDLAPYKIEKEGLTFAIEDLLNSLNAIQKTHFKSSITIAEAKISILSKSIIYRIIQELTTNICKHSSAKAASVHIESVLNHLVIQVRDNGQGFDKGKRIDGIGLKNVHNRVAYLNGKLEIDTESGFGVLFTIKIPYKSLFTNA